MVAQTTPREIPAQNLGTTVQQTASRRHDFRYRLMRLRHWIEGYCLGRERRKSSKLREPARSDPS